MFNHAAALIHGVRSTPSAPLRLLVAVLVMLQLATPVSATLADPGPAPVSHVDHLGNADDRGCRPFHDEAFCLSCRVLFNQPLGARTAPALGATLNDTGVSLRDLGSAIPDDHAFTPLRARAPPRV